ncbi:hypothetical protein Tco_0708051 [Tanacetum coccineum]
MMDAISNCTSVAANNLDQVIKPNIENVNTMKVTKWNHTRGSCSLCHGKQGIVSDCANECKEAKESLRPGHGHVENLVAEVGRLCSDLARLG